MSPNDIERIEFDLLLEAIWRRYGYDFRAYARATIERRTLQFLSGAGCATVVELIPRVLHDADFFSRLARQFSIPVTEMFRDPFVYRTLREKVLPLPDATLLLTGHGPASTMRRERATNPYLQGL